MAAHIDLGKEGEELAAQWLVQNGFSLVQRNWRLDKLEIDIIARRGKFLHFIEVKCRKASPNGHPEDNVSRKKFKNLQRAADIYLKRHPGNQWIQFDVMAITIRGNGEVEYFFIEDVFL